MAIRIRSRVRIGPAVVTTIDTDAQAFITAATITNTTQISAINTLVVSLKSYNIWSKLKAVYPFVGGTATSHKFNLKDPRDLDAAYRLTFTGGWTHSFRGVLSNAVNGYANTYFNALIDGFSDTNAHISFYSRTNTRRADRTLGISDASDNRPINLLINYNGLHYWTWNSYAYPLAATTGTGFYQMNRTSGLTTQGVINGSVVSTSGVTAIGTMLNLPFFIGTSNYNGVPLVNRYTDKECTFASFGDSLTTTQMADYHTAIQAYQTILNRELGTTARTVTDPDAQAFVNAAVIIDKVEADAIDNLVTSLKSSGLWTKMKAIYPFVGGTATSHKFNLKNPLDTNEAFRLSFIGGWTHSSYGALPNGTTGYANTFLSPNTTLSLDDVHISFYSRSNVVGGVDIGSCDSPGLLAGIYMLNRAGDFKNYHNLNGDGSYIETVGWTRGDGYFLLRRSNSTEIVNSRNAVNNILTKNTTSRTTQPIWIGSLNNGGVQSDKSSRQCAFASIGDGLTDTDASTLYTAVQAFQTTLGRNV